MNASSAPERIGLALSGGGARAMAFHLGVLRGLHEHGLLSRVHTVSAVSGGAVIAAMYVYGDEAFETFEARVLDVLRRGLQGQVVRRFFFSKRVLQAAATWPVANGAALALALARNAIGVLPRGASGSRAHPHPWITRLPAPPVRRVSRTDAFEDVIRARLFGDRTLDAPRRAGIDVVFNATELRTATAFRFGNRGSSCWRYGTVVGESPRISTAVAASAAFPLLLPALDRTFTFERDGEHREHRVVLTDGGVFDNLGVSVFLPGRDVTYGPHVYEVDGVICARAGEGQWAGDVLPVGWVGRMSTAFGVTHRKLEDGTVKLLHALVEAEKLRVLIPALGQQDAPVLKQLGQRRPPIPIPTDYVAREAVARYPTDFRAIPPSDLHRLVQRGRQQADLLAHLYWG